MLFQKILCASLRIMASFAVKLMTENELSSIVIGQAIKVHRILGPGLLESVYLECLFHLLKEAGLQVEKQRPMPLVFEGIKLDCGYRCDLVIENKLIIEIKSVDGLNTVHFAQLLTYLKLAEKKLGLLINFNESRLKNGIKRIVNKL